MAKAKRWGPERSARTARAEAEKASDLMEEAYTCFINCLGMVGDASALIEDSKRHFPSKEATVVSNRTRRLREKVRKLASEVWDRSADVSDLYGMLHIGIHYGEFE